MISYNHPNFNRLMTVIFQRTVISGSDHVYFDGLYLSDLAFKRQTVFRYV